MASGEPARAMASSSFNPTEPIGGWLNTADAMLAYSTDDGAPPKTVCTKASPSASATGVRLTRSVTSPMA